MMKKRQILHWAMGVIMTPLLGSCTSDDVVGSAGREECDIISGLPITVTSVTRATDGSTSSTPFDSGEIVWLWANKSDGSEYITAWQLTAKSGGSFTGADKYWPSDGSLLTFYALHGNFGNTTIKENSTPWADLSLTHTVETDQRTEAKKLKSDLLYAKKQYDNAIGIYESVSAYKRTEACLRNMAKIYEVHVISQPKACAIYRELVSIDPNNANYKASRDYQCN